MELAEPVERINKWLVDQFGIDTISGLPIWRVVWSEDQFEKRQMHVTDAGVYLLTPEIREVKKYAFWLKEKFILERLTIIPEIQKGEIAGNLSYEPLWVFETNKGVALPPKIEVCRIVIDTIYAATGHGGPGDTEVRQGSMRKYVDELANESPEQKEARITALEQDLFGNETDTTTSLAHGEGIVVPRNYGEH